VEASLFLLPFPPADPVGAPLVLFPLFLAVAVDDPVWLDPPRVFPLLEPRTVDAFGEPGFLALFEALVPPTRVPGVVEELVDSSPVLRGGPLEWTAGLVFLAMPGPAATRAGRDLGDGAATSPWLKVPAVIWSGLVASVTEVRGGTFLAFAFALCEVVGPRLIWTEPGSAIGRNLAATCSTPLGSGATEARNESSGRGTHMRSARITTWRRGKITDWGRRPDEE